MPVILSLELLWNSEILLNEVRDLMPNNCDEERTQEGNQTGQGTS